MDRPRALEVLVDLAQMSDGDGEIDDVAVLGDQVGGGDLSGAHASERNHPGHARNLDVQEWAPGPRGGDLALDQRYLGGGIDPVALGGVGQESPDHTVDGPLHGGDGGDAQALVDDGPARVVDAGDDPVDAERLTRHARREDVGVVAAGNR